MEGNIYRTNGLDCFTNGSLDLLADEYIFPPPLSHPAFFRSLRSLALWHLPLSPVRASFTEECSSDKRILQNGSSLTCIIRGLRVGRRSPAVHHVSTRAHVCGARTNDMPESPQCFPVPHIISIKPIPYLFRLVSGSSLQTFRPIYPIPSPPLFNLAPAKSEKFRLS